MGERFAQRFSIDVRRPEALETARVSATFDLAITPLAMAVLADAVGSKSLAGLSASEQRVWIAAVTQLGDELTAGSELLLSAIVRRPGWAYHRLLLGELIYISDRRSGAFNDAPARWTKPLRAAARAASGADAIWGFVGSAYLEAWDRMPPDARRDAKEILGRALLEPGFVSRSYPAVWAAMGPGPATRMIPESSACLATARDLLGRLGEVAAAARMQERWQAAEKRERARDLMRCEERAAFEDARGLLAACRTFASAHRPWQLDDAEGRRETARVVELWPAFGAGTWRSDPRAELVRFFLDGRTSDVDGPALAQLAADLSGVPDPVRAHLALLAHDRYGFEKLLRASETLGALEWTGFLTELCRAEIESNRIMEAEQAFSRIARAAREECGVLLVRRDLARATGLPREVEKMAGLLAEACPEHLGPESWAETGAPSLSLCVDPDRDAARKLTIKLVAATPALIAYGWDGARSGTVLVRGEQNLEVPLAGLYGRRILSLVPIAGPRVKVIDATRERAGTGSSSNTNPAAAHAAPSSTANVAGMAGIEKLNSTNP